MRVGPASKRNPSLSTTNLYIEGVPKEWTDADLRKHFGEFGEIAAARILVDKGSNASREVGFVHFTNHENALSAMETWQDNKAYKTAERPFKIKFANRARKKDEEEYEMMSSRNKNHRKMGHSNHRGSLSSMPPSSMPHAHNGSVSMMAAMDASSATSYNHPVGPSQYPQTEMNTPRFDEPCRYFQRGHCKRGKNCFYRHGNVAVTPKSSSSSHRHSSHHSYSHHQHHPHQQPHHAPQHHPHPAHHGHGHHGQHVHPSLIATHPSHAHPHYAIPPPPPPATYDPYTAAAVATATAAASMYPHTAAVPTDMSAYYQHYYNAYGATYPPQPSAATTAVAATPGDMAAYYQQAYAAQYPAAQYAAAPSYAGQYAAAASMPTQQPQQQQQPAVVTQQQQQQQQQQGMNNTGGGATDDKTNSTTTTETGSTVTNHAVAATAAVAATPVAAVQAPEMPTVGMQGAESSGYGASRQSSTAATDARWEPYKSQTNPNYYGHPTQQ
eukprot:CAMPEP_0197052388 /NCGR_PEP_ID=MMETSP1384-20130603/26880_1 /TAXON_ID=29189 /ORGANISM="Ammonia sp." /LENGTH=496 /DNA_ID=CAMNT_0042485115 /DNA_START=95 /DNA_END=1585 /DNA_ORIENTATION=+